jgi:hypothetical protein
VQKASSIKDLGVIIDEKLTFNEHCIAVAEKCGNIVNCILRSFQITNTHFLANMFKVFVVPIVDYCSSIYCPHTAKNNQLIESIQRNFTRRIICNDGMRYEDRLKTLKLEKLETRAIKNDLIKAYKIIFLNYGENATELFDFSGNLLSTRSNGLK